MLPKVLHFNNPFSIKTARENFALLLGLVLNTLSALIGIFLLLLFTIPMTAIIMEVLKVVFHIDSYSDLSNESIVLMSSVPVAVVAYFMSKKDN